MSEASSLFVNDSPPSIQHGDLPQVPVVSFHGGFADPDVRPTF